MAKLNDIPVEAHFQPGLNTIHISCGLVQSSKSNTLVNFGSCQIIVCDVQNNAELCLQQAKKRKSVESVRFEEVYLKLLTTCIHD